MNLYIKEKKDISEKVIAKSIHGKYPYKIYLEIKGSSKYGKYIVIVSDIDLKNNQSVDSICIKLDNVNKKKRRASGDIVRPNAINGESSALYKVKEVNIIEVGDTPIIVFEEDKELKSKVSRFGIKI